MYEHQIYVVTVYVHQNQGVGIVSLNLKNPAEDTLTCCLLHLQSSRYLIFLRTRHASWRLNGPAYQFILA